jgi:thiol:disulfide interchange protein DsbC
MKSISRLLLLSLCLAQLAWADEASIRAAMSDKFPYQKLISVTRTPYFGLYEVAFEDQLFYTDEKMQYLFSGSVIDLKTMANLTEAREKKLYPIKFDTMPLQLAIKKVVGKGTRRVAVFSDPNCSYCKKLEREMEHLTDVTIYFFPLALLRGSEKKTRAIWCAPNRLKAWEDQMLLDVTPPSASCDTKALNDIGSLARKMNIYVTPTLIFEDGFTTAGWMEAEPLEQQLSESSKK